MGRDDTFDLAQVEGEVGGALAFDDLGAGDAGDVRVHQVRGPEHGSRTPGATEGEAYRLDDLVRAVGSQHALGPHAVKLADGRTQRHRLAVGIALKGERLQLVE